MIKNDCLDGKQGSSSRHIHFFNPLWSFLTSLWPSPPQAYNCRDTVQKHSLAHLLPPKKTTIETISSSFTGVFWGRGKWQNIRVYLSISQNPQTLESDHWRFMGRKISGKEKVNPNIICLLEKLISKEKSNCLHTIVAYKITWIIKKGD